MFDVNFRELVGRADLRYEGTVGSSDEGLPIGNGTMAGLVWTSPWSVKLQINRADVYANDSTSKSFNRRNTDYSYACAWIDIDLGSGPQVFDAKETRQHLSVYDGRVTIAGTGVGVTLFAAQDGDLFVVEIDDRRTAPQPLTVKLQSLRPSFVSTVHHTAETFLSHADGRISLCQEFREGSFHCSSAVVAGVSGGTASVKLSDPTGGAAGVNMSRRIPGLGQTSEREISLCLEPAAAKRCVFIGSAASFDPDADTVLEAAGTVAAAVAAGSARIGERAAEWWSRFWEGCFVHLRSADGTAELVEHHYTYHLYLLACTSRGRYAPRFGGLLFSTHGDQRAWGSQQWWTNLSLYYRGLPPTGKDAVLDTCLRHYHGAMESCARAASEQWGSEGIFFPETMWFDGLGPLPEDIAAEMRDLYLMRKPWGERSPRFDEYAFPMHPHSSRWNWKGHGKWSEGRWTYGYNAVPPFSPVNHFFATGGEIAYLFWKRYEYTGDVEWLRTVGYPVISGVARFFASFPNLRREKDGLYHAVFVNQGEHLRGARDSFDFICAVRGVLPAAVKASEILGEDPAEREKWREIIGSLRGLPLTSEPDAVGKTGPGEPAMFAEALEPVIDGKSRPGLEEFNSRFYDYDLVNLAVKEADPELFAAAENTFRYSYPNGVGPQTPVRVMSGLPVIAAKLGRAEDFRQAVLNIINIVDPGRDFCDYEGQGSRGAMRNRMTNREGVNAIDAQRLGTALYAVNEALVQCDPAGPGEEPTVRICPAWPSGWDADFRLRIRGGHILSSRIAGGKIAAIEIQAPPKGAAASLRMVNPWPGRRVSVLRGDGRGETLGGELLTVSVPAGGKITISPEGVEAPAAVIPVP